MCKQLTEFFDGARYRINKFLLGLNGLWFYQEKKNKYILMGVTVSFFFTGLFGQIQNIVIHRDDWSTILPALGTFLVHLVCVVKMSYTLLYADDMRLLLERIYDDWHTPMGPEEKVLARYADDGRLFTLTYTVWLYISIAFYLLLSTVPRIIMVNGWANITPSTLFPIDVYYTSHDEDYYVFIQSHLSLAIIVVLTILIAVDGMFIVFIQHGCGIFAAVSYRLEHLIDREELQVDLHPPLAADTTFRIVVDCIEKHMKAIEYADHLAYVYSWPFLSMLGMNMMTMSLAGLQVVTSASPDSLDEALRQTILLIAQILHLFFENFLSQKLTDHSVEIFTSVTKSKWYLCSLRTRVLLQFILLRSETPWVMKAGKMFTMSMENFSAVMRTSMSYLTILRTMD